MSKAPNDDIDQSEEGPQGVRQIFQQWKAEGKDVNTLPTPGLFRKLHPEIWQWFLNRKGGNKTQARHCMDYQVRKWKAHFFPNGK